MHRNRDQLVKDLYDIIFTAEEPDDLHRLLRPRSLTWPRN